MLCLPQHNIAVIAEAFALENVESCVLLRFNSHNVSAVRGANSVEKRYT